MAEVVVRLPNLVKVFDLLSFLKKMCSPTIILETLNTSSIHPTRKHFPLP